MIAPVAVLVIGLSGMAYGWATDNGALLILGFWIFLISLPLVDRAVDNFNNKVSDDLNHSGALRVGYEREDVA